MTTKRELLDVLEMLRSPAWQVFAEYVQEQNLAYREQALMPLSSDNDIYECERAKSAESLTRNLLSEFAEQVRVKHSTMTEE